MRDFAKQFYYSAAWKKCRQAYISMRQSVDGGICEKCGENPGYIIHHKTELTPENITDPAVTLSFDNLMYLCHDCHNRIHGRAAEMPERSVKYIFGPDGCPVPVA